MPKGKLSDTTNDDLIDEFEVIIIIMIIIFPLMFRVSQFCYNKKQFTRHQYC